MASAVCDKVWKELRKLRDVPPLQSPQDTYKYADYQAYIACNEVKTAVILLPKPRTWFGLPQAVT